MPRANLPRTASAALLRLLRRFPAVLVVGPRQCGKTTLVRDTLSGWEHFDLERPSDAALISADVEGFLSAHPRRIVIDEAQRLPALFPALRHALDGAGGHGRVVLLGSSSPALLRGVSESLAGRVAVLELTPFLGRELADPRLAAERAFWGGFPRVLLQRGAAGRSAWLDAWVGAVLERDLPMLGVHLPAARLRLLLQMLTHVHGNLLNVSDLARSLGVSPPTVAHDLDVLEGTFFINRVPPYFANVQKRLSKASKVYLRDTGALHLLAGLRRPAELATWDRRGASFEGLVVEEIAALARERIVRPGVFFWRSAAGAEVDLLIADGQRLVPIEIKLGATIEGHALRGLKSCMADLGLKRGFVVTGGGARRRASPEIEVVPFSDVVSGRCDFGFGRAPRTGSARSPGGRSPRSP